VNDVLNEDEPGPAVHFGSVAMKKVGQFSMGIIEAVGAGKKYAEVTLKSSKVWIYNPGTTVYELQSPKAVYVMQSYSQAIDKTLSLETLDDLKFKLAMPKGWKFGSRVLMDELRLGGLGNAVVINDNFGCTYQKLES
jgi:hypothetical protein